MLDRGTASVIGQPIHVDKAIKKRTRLKIARMCIEVEATIELPKYIQVKVEEDSVDVHVEYQWMPPLCTDCKIFGHETSKCPKSN